MSDKEFTPIQIGDTALAVTGILLSQYQESFCGKNQGEHRVLFSVRDENTGETGHVLYATRIDGSDIIDEEIRTDNPLLFAKEHPENEVCQDWLSYDGPDTSNTMTDEIKELIGKQIHSVAYDEGPDGWGLYAE